MIKRKGIVFVLLLLVFLAWGNRMTRNAYQSLIRYQQISHDILALKEENQEREIELMTTLNNMEEGNCILLKAEQKNEFLDQLFTLQQTSIASITGYKMKGKEIQTQIATVYSVEEAKQFPSFVNQIECVIETENLIKTVTDLENMNIKFESITILSPNQTILLCIRLMGGEE